MEDARFEEKQYEIGLLFELAGPSTAFFPAGQVLESLVGFDFAVAPSKISIWDLLSAGCPPGVVLTPSLWPTGRQPPPARLPSHYVSLVVQAKRPQFLDHWSAGQHHHWQGPYFRFYLSTAQQDLLAHLETQTTGQALVRYAAAAFIEYEDLERFQANRTIANNSTFVAPLALQGHQLWSYAGAGTTGYANPGPGEELGADNVDTLLARAEETARHQTLSEHVRRLAEGLRDDTGESWTDLLLEDGRLQSDEARAALRAWAIIAAAVAEAGAMWIVLAF